MSRVHAARSSSFKDGDGTLVEYFEGDPVKDEHVALLDSWDALVPVGEEHLTPSQRTDMALNPDLAASLGIEPVSSVPSEPDPTGGTGERITGDYASSGHTASQLQAELEARRAEGRTIDVEGTGSGGNILRGDLEKALAADDAAAAA